MQDGKKLFAIHGSRSRAGVLLALLVVLPVAAESSKLPPLAEVQQHIDAEFQQDRHHRPETIITRSQVARILKSLEQIGWQVADGQEILGAVLDDQHILVRTLNTPAGLRFLSKVAGRDLMYDRLERISQVSGGPELLRDLVKLPDGEKYAKPRSGGGVPDLLDLLPKNASGKTRRIKDYDQPTGHIFTAAELRNRLTESYRKAEE